MHVPPLLAAHVNVCVCRYLCTYARTYVPNTRMTKSTLLTLKLHITIILLDTHLAHTNRKHGLPCPGGSFQNDPPGYTCP